MAQPPDQPPEEKGLSAHQAGKFAPHGKINYDPDAAPAKRRDDPTVREEEIALLLAKDLTYEEISKEKKIEVSTVKSHVHSLIRKIKGRTRASVIIWVLQRQLEKKDEEILILKELLANGGSSAASETRPD
jgi:DNA-binding NarL/FixJ family response regulator